MIQKLNLSYLYIHAICEVIASLKYKFITSSFDIFSKERPFITLSEWSSDLRYPINFFPCEKSVNKFFCNIFYLNKLLQLMPKDYTDRI